MFFKLLLCTNRGFLQVAKGVHKPKLQFNVPPNLSQRSERIINSVYSYKFL
jgi:hypothetical protein